MTAFESVPLQLSSWPRAAWARRRLRPSRAFPCRWPRAGSWSAPPWPGRAPSANSAASCSSPARRSPRRCWCTPSSARRRLGKPAHRHPAARHLFVGLRDVAVWPDPDAVCPAAAAPGASPMIEVQHLRLQVRRVRARRYVSAHRQGGVLGAARPQRLRQVGAVADHCRFLSARRLAGFWSTGATSRRRRPSSAISAWSFSRRRCFPHKSVRGNIDYGLRARQGARARGAAHRRRVGRALGTGCGAGPAGGHAERRRGAAGGHRARAGRAAGAAAARRAAEFARPQRTGWSCRTSWRVGTRSWT